jgi:hypothetical protein
LLAQEVGYARLLTVPAEIDISKQIIVPCHVEWAVDAKNEEK